MLAVAGRDDDLAVGLERQDFGQGGETLGGAVGIGRKPEVEGDDRRFVQPHRFERAGAVADDDDRIIVIGPLELALQPFVVLDDQQGRLGRCVAHAIFRSSARPAAAAGT